MNVTLHTVTDVFGRPRVSVSDGGSAQRPHRRACSAG